MPTGPTTGAAPSLSQAEGRGFESRPRFRRPARRRDQERRRRGARTWKPTPRRAVGAEVPRRARSKRGGSPRAAAPAQPLRARPSCRGVEARQERLAANEAWFREINEQIESQALKLGSDTHRYDFICECANVD